MNADLDLYGVFFPMLLAYMAMAYATKAGLRLVLLRVGFYRWVWHPALFNLALFVAILGGLVALATRIPSL
ncbi:MAG: rane protein [Hydrocarboniphaga sp.]|uniref:DUF1656 domain-containing protein n=1 Tax=Hydrocarboniphaga sp. TaxID=2033016 RepID=UPI002633600E|nr:DUF1656 domain-containing protein [Hydrocarboniphaga sp.]MDB5968423.1 rane protein [Hydrocarboniphaga sp.]